MTVLVLGLAARAGAVEVQVLSKTTTLDKEVWEAQPVYTYKSLGFPKELSRDFLQRMLQAFFDQYRGKAFRSIGDARDFNHGHIVTDGTAVKALLLHTQEQAKNAPSGSPFSYVDAGARNWVVYLEDPTRFVNAETLRYQERPYDWPERWERQTSFNDYVYKYKTITVMMLDPKKTGVEARSFLESEKGEQLNFNKASCPVLSEEKLARSNVVPIDADAGRQCLYVVSFKCMFKSHFKCDGVPLR